jgi:ATP-dependent DNA helicase RecG
VHSFFDKPIEFLKGVGPQRAELLNKELQIFNFSDLLQHYPFRHEDRSKFYKISELQADLPYIQIIGEFKSFATIGAGRKTRLVGRFSDETGTIEIVWFKGAQWIKKSLSVGVRYVVFGKATSYGGKLNIAHPEIEIQTEKNTKGGYLQPVYNTTEKLKKKNIESRFFSNAMKVLLVEAVNYIHETLPKNLINQFHLIDKKTAVVANQTD